MDTLLLIVGLSALLLLVMLLTRTREKPSRSRNTPKVRWLDPAVQATFDRQAGRAVTVPKGKDAMWERKVLSQLRGDRAAMERLVAGQAKRFPRAGRAELLERVYDDYVRDQR
ncbi:hypothetical protein [Deinococcus wulumuqiensis]|uniref:Uncharacterized protein n=1 Tax=Deinococcus wulumuqiensis TaxID=980427 RepID=A0AAV4K641_9DEIO|nr:hypothetical protein [Deinococcus wulumuqiensis]QII19804.1 hypothetical protein G6R31_02820 [Deinococcus wulumuqiensis R12]GGI71932.1 hypothetical protein GCM10010914_02450 [Deinococcus wulumuqiensis]GGP28363.1 hypothetical protein GCM10008021_00140 [Deinococcus wulumuqiensis]